MSGPYENQLQRGEIVGQTAVQAKRREQVMTLWLEGSTYEQIRDALSISTWTVMQDLKFCKNELKERFAATLEQRRDQLRLELDFIKTEIYSLLDGGEGKPAPILTTGDRIKLYQTFMQATKLEATIDGLTSYGSTSGSDESGRRQPMIFLIKNNLPGADPSSVATVEGRVKEVSSFSPSAKASEGKVRVNSEHEKAETS